MNELEKKYEQATRQYLAAVLDWEKKKVVLEASEYRMKIAKAAVDATGQRIARESMKEDDDDAEVKKSWSIWGQ